MVAVGCMPDGNKIIWFQTVLYFLASLLGFFVCIPLGILLRNFQGSCILFAQILDWRPPTIWPWSETACDYVLFMNLAINIFYATFMGFASLLIGFKHNIGRSKSLAKLHDWNVAYILNALNPVFLIINIIIFALVVTSTATVTAGTQVFCKYAFEYMSKYGTGVGIGASTLSTTSTTTTTTMAPTTVNCNFIYNAFDDATNTSVTYTMNLCSSTVAMATTTWRPLVIPQALSSCSQLQSWDLWWSRMRIIRGRDEGINGSNFYVCLVMACVASFMLIVVWLIQMALNVGMLCRVCSCEVAEEKRKDDQTLLIAQRRSRLATPSHTPGTGQMGRPMGSQQMMGPGQQPPAIPRQYPGPQPTAAEAQPMFPEKRPLPPDDDVDYPTKSFTPPTSDLSTDDVGPLTPVPPQYQLPPVQRRMEPSPRRPVGEQQFMSPDTSMSDPPPPPYQLPPVQVRSPPTKK